LIASEKIYVVPEKFWIASEKFWIASEKFWIASEKIYVVPEKFWIASENFLIAIEKFWIATEKIYVVPEKFWIATVNFWIATENFWIAILKTCLRSVFSFGALEFAPTRFDGSKGRLRDGVRNPMGFHRPNVFQDDYDIRTIQDLLGHKDVKTTIIYTHVLNRCGRGVRSPAA
jgi:hypothetical protein